MYIWVPDDGYGDYHQIGVEITDGVVSSWAY